MASHEPYKPPKWLLPSYNRPTGGTSNTTTKNTTTNVDSNAAGDNSKSTSQHPQQPQQPQQQPRRSPDQQAQREMLQRFYSGRREYDTADKRMGYTCDACGMACRFKANELMRCPTCGGMVMRKPRAKGVLQYPAT
ncbi:8c75b279-4d7d-4249-9bda-73cead882b52 [Thermothielavioides terrestris]|uniref:8c75b279-4d7d-4249-9bda-73cead882b52 n=1 Tax=Thermothielavioides terrestris TaxID=2587410 RepID=A0A446B7T8_9PEZI|nr:8c75b279-4d7d-4249-9bda-73cead882b52 [Thermothielavioides terrestris]